MDSPYGGRTEPRLREHFDRLVDRISTYEVKALADGDGFTEKQYEPASLDELLALSATLIPPVPAGLKDTVSSDLETSAHDIPIPLNQRVLAFVELFQGRLHEFLDRLGAPVEIHAGGLLELGQRRPGELEKCLVVRLQRVG